MTKLYRKIPSLRQPQHYSDREKVSLLKTNHLAPVQNIFWHLSAYSYSENFETTCKSFQWEFKFSIMFIQLPLTFWGISFHEVIFFWWSHDLHLNSSVSHHQIMNSLLNLGNHNSNQPQTQGNKQWCHLSDWTNRPRNMHHSSLSVNDCRKIPDRYQCFKIHFIASLLTWRYGWWNLPLRNIPSFGFPRRNGSDQGDEFPNLPPPSYRHNGTIWH